jgi:hypothetical protein
VSVWWKTKRWTWGIYTPHIHWVARGTGTPKDRDEFNRREVWEWDGWVCDLEAIGATSIFSVIRSAAALVRMLSTLDLSCAENAVRRQWNCPLVDCASWTPEAAKKAVSFL